MGGAVKAAPFFYVVSRSVQENVKYIRHGFLWEHGMMKVLRNPGREAALVIIFATLSVGLWLMPTGFEDRVEKHAVRCRGLVTEVDNSDVRQIAMIRTGNQGVTLKLLDGQFEGRTVSGNNSLLGQMDRDKVFEVGDTVLVVLSLNKKHEIVFVNPQDHYRLGWEALLLGLFALALILFGGWTGVKALLSFVFTALMLWKVLVPALLKGHDPVLISLGLTAALTGAVIFLVAGINRKGLTAFLGAFLGVALSCVLAKYFTAELRVHGAVLPFAETLLYAGYGHLNLTEIYIAAVFLAASGAVMDLAMDVAAGMNEVVLHKPDISRTAVIRSGLSVGRAVVGTMTTTLLLAYSGGYLTFLMAFMAQGVPPANLLNLIYTAAEVLKTLVGSFGLVMVAPFTALVGGLVLPSRGLQRDAIQYTA
jgi:uncharacterized membrane protein